MERIPIRFITRDYHQVAPLAHREVVPDGIDLTVDWSVPISTFITDVSVQVGEMSFSQYVRRQAAGNTEITGLPVFVMRGFRHRCFFVRRGSSLRSFRDLAGRRVGTESWPDSGNTWSRSLLRREGVELDQVEWWTGPVDDAHVAHPTAVDLPSFVRPLPVGQTLVESLLREHLDAVMIPWPPPLFHEPNSPIVRLIPDFRHAEQEYARQVGFYPGMHIVGVRSSLLDEHPWVYTSLLDAFEQSWRLAEERLWVLTNSTPWSLDEMEQITSILGPNWQPHGVAANQTMIQTFCDELTGQGIIARSMSATDLFSQPS